MMYPWINENKALHKYRQSNVARILPIFVKSIPLPPDILPTRPVNISVVAFPRILGPTILKMVLPMANMTTKSRAILYFPI